MARHEADREDLFAEAVALVRRVELETPDIDQTIVAGFKRDGGLSLYFGGDPVYHFDAQGRLKRAFRAGRLYRTQGDTLAELVRERTPTETILRRRDLPPQQREMFLKDMQNRLASLSAQIDRGTFTVRRQVPADDHTLVESELVAALQKPAGLDAAFSNFLAPRFRGKR